MPQMIPFQKRAIGNETIETVDGRDLHAALEIEKHYTDWMKAQLKRGYLIENEDFVLYHQKGIKNNRPTSEYFLTFDAAKHVAMMSGSKKGKEIRDYFITCEKQLRGLASSENSPWEMIIKMAQSCQIQEQKILAIEETQRRHMDIIIANQEETIKTQALALRALESQMYMTLRQYRFVHHLEHQLPDDRLKRFATFLTGYCAEHNIPVSAEPVADRLWGKENRYHVDTINMVLPSWLARDNGQLVLDD